tara:strand:+ start:333 stop:857 length:525 start_codon:yes stop_codon:yes gene_type:complete
MLKFLKKGKNLCLIGFMGSGKSALGKDLSKIYKMDFIDTDHEIERITGKSIEELFSEFGEGYFRKIEEKTCIKALENNNCIISLGGGSIINSKIRKGIKKNSYSIYLKVDKNILLKRLRYSQKRPLLNDANIEDVVEELFNQRKNYYNEADLIIDNNYDRKKVLENIKSQFKKL